MNALWKATIATGIALTILQAAQTASGQAKSEQALRLPPYQEQTLPNGLRVFLMENHEVPLVTVNLLVPVGSAVDQPGSEGIASLTGRLLMRGAGEMSAEEIARAIEQAGGQISVSTGSDFTVLSAGFLAADLARALDLLSTVALRPAFPQEEVDREKEMVIAEIASVKDEPSDFTNREFRRALLGAHPYAHPVDGSEASVAGMTRDGLLAFYRASFVPAGAILAVVGDIAPANALALVRARFGEWQGSASARNVAPLEVRSFPGRRVIVIDKPDATQSQIRIGNIAVPYDTPEYFPLLVANTVLGGGFTSRLVEEIRVNRGLSYGARSSLAQLKDGGYFSVSTFTKNATLRETIDVAFDQLARMRNEKLTAAELEGAKRYLVGLFPFNLETNDQLANWITTLTFYGRPLTFLEEYGAKVNAVTADDCLAVARERFWHDDDLLFVMTHYAETKDQLNGLGKIEVVRLEELE